MALVDPLSEAGAPFGFGLSRLLSVRLYLGKPPLPSAHLEPIVRETDLAARVSLAFLRIGFDRLQQVLGLHTGLHRSCDQTQSGPPVSDPVLWIGRQDLLRFKIFNLLRRLAPARRWFMDGLGSTVNPVPRSPWTPYRVQAGRGSQ